MVVRTRSSPSYDLVDVLLRSGMNHVEHRRTRLGLRLTQRLDRRAVAPHARCDSNARYLLAAHLVADVRQWRNWTGRPVATGAL
jgi:hypothetical protein